MELGYLFVQCYLAEQALPLEGCEVHIYNSALGIDEFLQTQEDGKTETVAVPAPNRSLSLDPNYFGEVYATVDIDITMPGYTPVEIRGAQVFAQETAILEQPMLPNDTSVITVDPILVPVHQLRGQTQNLNDARNSNTTMSAKCRNCPRRHCCRKCCCKDCDNGGGGSDTPATFVLDYPIIPQYITVHLGRPTVSARDVTVSFKDYIKNVASSEIYPTWPTESLRANIYCQISLALNRVYTEWYTSRGYNFNITNSTTVDQAFVYGRNIYDSVARIVDDIFNEYVRKFNTIEPFYTEYCDGRQVSCPGLKQWGTVTLAEQGRNSFQILQYYYGNNIEIVDSNRIESVTGSFPGVSLRVGARSDDVAVIQRQLNRIAINYPLIPVSFPIDGIFGPNTERSVRAFQKQFNLSQDGIVGKSTWYKISYIYVAVKKLAELKSEGEYVFGNGQYPGTPLREGSSGGYVQEAQFYLQTVANFTPAVSSIKIDGNFGRGTRAAVIQFQNLARITADGIIGATTWRILYRAYQDTKKVVSPDSPVIYPYPGTALRLGSQGQNVRIIQEYLNLINASMSFYPQIVVDGIFGSATQASVIAFQRNYGLAADGVVGRLTWDKIMSIYSSTYNFPTAAQIQHHPLDNKIYIGSSNLIYRE